MASSAQILANQANAQFSTGPKSAEGKARSSKNALKNGFHAVPALKPEDRERFLQFEADLRESIYPSGALEEGAFLQLRDAAWRLEELRRQVNALFADQTQSDPLESEDFEKLQNQANRARAAAEMSFYRALKTLGELQTTRLAREIHLTEDEHSRTPIGACPRAFTYQMVDGFKFNRADRELFIGTNGFRPPSEVPETAASATP